MRKFFFYIVGTAEGGYGVSGNWHTNITGGITIQAIEQVKRDYCEAYSCGKAEALRPERCSVAFFAEISHL